MLGILEVARHSWRLLCNPRGLLCQLPLRSLAWSWSWGTHWLRTGSVEVAELCLVLRYSLAIACSLRDHLLIPALAGVTGLGLLPLRSLAHTCSSRGHCLGPAPVEVAGWSLVLQRLLAWACSHSGHWFRTGPQCKCLNKNFPEQSREAESFDFQCPLTRYRQPCTPLHESLMSWSGKNSCPAYLVLSCVWPTALLKQTMQRHYVSRRTQFRHFPGNHFKVSKNKEYYCRYPRYTHLEHCGTNSYRFL